MTRRHTLYSQAPPHPSRIAGRRTHITQRVRGHTLLVLPLHLVPRRRLLLAIKAVQILLGPLPADGVAVTLLLFLPCLSRLQLLLQVEVCRKGRGGSKRT